MEQVYALGIDLGGSAVKWGVVARDGGIAREGLLPVESRGHREVIRLIGDIIETALADSQRPLAGIGIGSPGLIDSERRIVRLSPNFPDWRQVPLIDELETRLKSPVPMVLENDANVLVYSETRWGGAIGKRHVVVLTLGTGVGGGVMIDGRLLRGSNGGGGELGHIPLDILGPACGTGVKGSFECYCNIEGVMREAREVYNPHTPPADPGAVTEAANNGDPRAIEVWRRIGMYLGCGVAAYINIFNPQAVLVGGGLSGAGEHLFGPARMTAESRSFAPNWADATFGRAQLQYQAGLLGAAAMAFDEAGIATITAQA